jgi:hypothetical protein
MLRKLPFILLVVTVAACSKDPGNKTASPAPAPASGATAAPAATAKAAAPEAAPGAPAAPAAEAKPRVEGKGFIVEVKAPADVAAGGEGTAQVVLTATGEYHLNKEFPTALEVTPPPGVEVPKSKLTVADAAKFEEKTATWEVKFTAKDAGEKKFAASFKFAVCTATTCDPKKEALGWTVPVK